MNGRKKKEPPDIGQALTLLIVQCGKMKDEMKRLADAIEAEHKESKAFRKQIRREMREMRK